MKKSAFGITLMLVLTSTCALVYHISPVRAAGTIYIRADGSIDPSTANITTTDGVTYTFTDNIATDSIVVERNGAVIDGAGHALQGPGASGASGGINLTGRSNVRIQNARISGFRYGIWLSSSSNISINENHLDNNRYGVYEQLSDQNSISENNITTSIGDGVYARFSDQNSLCRNNIIVNYGFGVYVESSNNNSISENSIMGNQCGVYVYWASKYNGIFRNNITASSGRGVYVEWYSDYNQVNQNNITTGDGVDWAVFVSFSKCNSVSGNSITASGVYTVFLERSSHTRVSENSISAKTGHGVYIDSYSYYNSVSQNNITADDGHGVFLDEHSEDNSIDGNNINTTNGYGVYLYLHSDRNIVAGNSIASSSCGVCLYECSYNVIYNNNFMDNTIQACPFSATTFTWDSGYPSGGNYWSDYGGTDLYRGPHQNETGSDGIGDTPYVIDPNNQDNYPLITPYPSIHSVAIEAVTASKTVVGQNFVVYLDINVANPGHFLESFNITMYANTTTIGIAEVTLASRNSITITLAWSTSGFVKGSYTLSAYIVPVEGETYNADNLSMLGPVVITLPGDVDGNFSVNVFDVVKITSCYGKTQIDPIYYPNADIDGNGVINIFDVVICTGQYGKKWP